MAFGFLVLPKKSASASASAPRFNTALALESIAARYSVVNAGGTVSLDTGGLHVPCGVSGSDFSGIILVDSDHSSLPITGNPELIFTARVGNNDTGDDAVGFIGFGTLGSLGDFTDNILGFEFVVTGQTATVSAITSDGVTDTTTVLSGIDSTLGHTYRLTFTGSSVKFYVDSVLKATHTTHLPTATRSLVVDCSQVSGPNTPELQVWAIAASVDA